ncbi:peroxiredoxin [Brevibacillus parabrevis]|uniref:peroxiredoxin family protein n=1 Tax=Brevibacillus parabrevis TaxID=54914 RepID=UPI00113BF849|nr:TlpA disulfide reductase family protein [Brevibacillus parabrevis]MED1722180.1 TlpA disulfide reductase family protein [Brevibacillus parabrevis]TGV29566.1 TlpA family protein disulfide reductase [Mesorhizobium sp. M00.F.Ca.ET.186.01.1.1]
MKFNQIAAFVVLIGLLAWGIVDASILSPKGKNAATSGPGATSTAQIGTEKGNAAPDFELQQLDGKKVKLSDFRGKKVIVNLWATWCPPCRAEIPDMQQYYEANKDNDVVILGVNLTTTETKPEDVGAFVKAYGMTFPVLLDEDKQVTNEYKAISIPTSYIIDSNGIVQHKYIGPMSYEWMEEALAAIQ